MEELTRQQKAEACLLIIAKRCADDKPITFESDWEEFGAATLIADGGHTHIGHEGDSDEESFTNFVNSLYGQLIHGQGLSWVKDEPLTPPRPQQTSPSSETPEERQDHS